MLKTITIKNVIIHWNLLYALKGGGWDIFEKDGTSDKDALQ